MHWVRLLVSSALVSAMTAAGALADPFAYASNEGSGTVSVIDTATDKVTATFNVGGKPRGIALSPDRSRLYVSEQGSNSALIIDTSNGTQLARIPVGNSPEGIYLSSDGKLLSVSVEEDDTVVIIDTAAAKIVQRVKMRGKNPEHAVFSPDGHWLYVSSEEADSVDIVDLTKGEVIKSVKVGDRPRGSGFLPDGTRAYVAAENADTVNVFDVATHEVIARIRAAQPARTAVTIRPDGKRVYVSSGGEGNGCVGDRSVDQHHHRRDPCRQETLEHGDRRRWEKTVCRLRAVQRGRGDRHHDQHQGRRDCGGKPSLGRCDPLRPAEGRLARGRLPAGGPPASLSSRCMAAIERSSSAPLQGSESLLPHRFQP